MSEEEFKKACAWARERYTKGRSTPEDDKTLYGLYMQALHGDCNRPQPYAIQFTERAKHDSWSSHKGMTQQAARLAYIRYCNSTKA